MRRGVAGALCALCGCANTGYVPGVVARDELTARVRTGSLELWDSRGKVDQGSLWPFRSWRRLEGYVACVPRARQHARTARSLAMWSGAVHALGLLGVVVGSVYTVYEFKVPEFGKLTATPRYNPVDAYAMAYFAAALPLFPLGVGLKNHANGHAVDAMNFYNDAVGSLGDGCHGSPGRPRPTVVIPPPGAERETKP